MTHVWANTTYPPAQSYILMAIADVVNDTNDNRFFMSISNLAVKTKCSERTIQRALRQFEIDGWLSKVSEGAGGRQATEYEFNLERGDKLSPVPNEPATGDTGVTAGVTDGAFTPLLELKNNSKEQPSPEILEVCSYLANAIGNRGLRAQPQSEAIHSARWATEARLLLEGKIGGGDTLEDAGPLTVAKIKASIDYAMNDAFWAVNILSPAKLRKQYPTLRAQAKAAKEKKPNPATAPSTFIPTFNAEEFERSRKNALENPRTPETEQLLKETLANMPGRKAS